MTDPATINVITLILFLFPWLVWLVWELALLWMRRPGSPSKPQTISMVARAWGPRLTSLSYLWGMMATHWWWNASAYAPIWAGVASWAVAIGLFVWDILLLDDPVAGWPLWLRRIRHPLIWLVLGALAGRFLFPQVALD